MLVKKCGEYLEQKKKKIGLTPKKGKITLQVKQAYTPLFHKQAHPKVLFAI